MELKYLVMRNNYKQVAPNGASEPRPYPKSPVRGGLIVEHNKQSETKAPLGATYNPGHVFARKSFFCFA